MKCSLTYPHLPLISRPPKSAIPSPSTPLSPTLENPLVSFSPLLKESSITSLATSLLPFLLSLAPLPLLYHPLSPRPFPFFLNVHQFWKHLKSTKKKGFMNVLEITCSVLLSYDQERGRKRASNSLSLSFSPRLKEMRAFNSIILSLFLAEFREIIKGDPILHRCLS